jgi:hypothetical protein
VLGALEGVVEYWLRSRSWRRRGRAAACRSGSRALVLLFLLLFSFWFLDAKEEAITAQEGAAGLYGSPSLQVDYWTVSQIKGV